MIALIVGQNSTSDIDCSLKLSKPKALKVTKTWGNIESLIPNTAPYLSQDLPALSIYPKIGLSTIIDES